MADRQAVQQGTHRLKTWTGYFRDVREGRKTFELRRNDRLFQPGDMLELVEFDPHTGRETGEVEYRRAGYILRAEAAPGFGLAAGFCIIALEPEHGA